jgi:hypothetical protein
MAKKTVSDLSKSGQVNSFTGGINTDLHPMLQPNDTLTDCLNGTLITYNGNENMLQNDMGNYELKHAQLPEGYIPMGMKEYQGILYIVSWNPFTKKAQIGSYPSPKTRHSEELDREYVVEPLNIEEFDFSGQTTFYRECTDESRINSLETGITDEELAEIIFRLSEKLPLYVKQDGEFTEYKTNHLFSGLNFDNSYTIFTDDFSEDTVLGTGDFYHVCVDDENTLRSDLFQTFKYFVLDKNKKKFYLDNVNEHSAPANNLEDYDPVVFDHNG